MKRALPSIMAQTYPNIEIIVAAHGCTDNTVKRVEEFGEARGSSDQRVLRVLRVPRTKYYRDTPENRWLAGAVEPANAAIAAARGEWIARCDDDDIWTPSHIERLLRFAQAGNFEFVSGAYERERDGVRDIVHDDGEDPPVGGTATWLYRSYLRFMRENPDCWRKTWNRVSDTDHCDRFRKAGVRIGHLDQVFAYQLPRPGQTVVGSEAVRRYIMEPEATAKE